MWTVLENSKHWVNYLSTIMRDTRDSDNDIVVVGGEPTEYPCAVTSIVVSASGGRKLLSAFMYSADAKNLLNAGSPRSFGEKAKLGRAVVHPETIPEALPVDSAQQGNFNRWVSAHLLTVAYFLRETGICKPAAFEEKLLEMLETVTEVCLEKKEAAIARQEKNYLEMMQRLSPPQ